MKDAFFDELKSIKTKLSKEEKDSKKVEKMDEREKRLRDEFEEYMSNHNVKKV